MNLRASSIDRELRDILLKEKVTGKTIAVYDRVVYLRTLKGLILVLVRMDVGNGPCFILIEHEGSLKSGYPSFNPDEQFESGVGMVIIGGGRIIVEAGHADTWEPSLAPTESHRLSELEACFKTVRAIAQSRGINGGLGPLLDRLDELCGDAQPMRGRSVSDSALEVCKKVHALADAIGKSRKTEVRDSVRRLIGLGEGLTPSCDDLLVGLMGFLYGVRCVPSLKAYARRTLTWLGEVMESAAEKTTPVSGHFLREAARGRFTERVKELLEALFAADEKRMERAGERVLEYGATSGVDLIFGMALGYEIATRRSSLVARKLTQ